MVYKNNVSFYIYDKHVATTWSSPNTGHVTMSEQPLHFPATLKYNCSAAVVVQMAAMGPLTGGPLFRVSNFRNNYG